MKQRQHLIQFLDSLLDVSPNTSVQTHLTHINEQITQVQAHIQSSIKSDWPAFQHQWLTGSSLYHQSLELENQLDQLETQLDHPEDGLIPNLLSALKDRQAIATQRSESLQTLKAANSLVTAYKALLVLSKLVYSNDLVTAASKLPETKLALGPLYPFQAASSLAKQAIYRIQELEEDLKQRLIDDTRSCLTFQNEKTQEVVFQFRSTVNARANSQQNNSFISWSSAVESLETLIGEEHTVGHLKKIVSLSIDKIITPLIESFSSSEFHLILIERQNPDESSCVLSFKQQAEGSRFDFYDSLRLLFSTIQEKLLKSKSLHDKFALLLSPSLEAKLLSQVLDSELPDSTRDEKRLSQLSKLLSETRLFANWLQDHGWLSHSKENALLNWCDQVQDRFLHKVATRVLELARHEMLTTQWESTVVSWEITSEIEPKMSPSSSKTNENRALPSKTSDPASSFNPSSTLSQRLPQSSKQSAGFKSLFRFVSGTSPQPRPYEITPSAPSEDPTLSSPSESKNFGSLFNFDPAPSRVNTDSSKVQFSSVEQNHHSNNLDDVYGSSQPSSPLMKNRQSSPSLSPMEPIPGNPIEHKAEEDIDWDLDGELEDPQPLHPFSSPHSVKLSQVAVMDDDIEEDAWGLDGSNEEPTAPIDNLQQSESKTSDPEKTVSSQKVTESSDPSVSISKQASNDLVEEEEPDPDGWGFDEEPEEPPTLTEDESDVLRLRGGVGTSPAASEMEDEDGWGWNEDVTGGIASGQIDNSKHNQPSGKKKDNINDNLDGTNNQSITHVEQLTISTLAQKILSIVKEVVDDAIQTESPEFPSESLRKSGAGLIKLGFDIVDLFRIIMFTHHFKLLDSVPSLSVQFSNDCDWLSYQLSSIRKLQNEYQDQVKIATHKLKDLGNKVRKNQIANQKAALMECLNEAEGFVETSRKDRFLACQRACKQVTHTLETLAQVWKPVMLKKEYFESMGELVETVLQRILNEIEEQTDIEENDSKSLNQLCKSLHNLVDLFNTTSQPIVGLDSISSTTDTDDNVYRYVPSWFKFCFLSELLEASMADIMWMYQEGHLSEFTKQEIVGLIKALFADSQLRAKNIDLILQ